MSHASQLAVEITKGDDNLDIWVDANNNGERDDDDVNIYVTAGGGFYTTSPTFKHALDTAIQGRIKELAIALLNKEGENLTQAEEVLSELALELVVKAQDLNDEVAAQPAMEMPPVIASQPMQAQLVTWNAEPAASQWQAELAAAEPTYEPMVESSVPHAYLDLQPQPLIESVPVAEPVFVQPVIEPVKSEVKTNAIWINLSDSNH